MFGKAKPSVSYGALIDIGSGSVGVAIVASDHAKPLPELLFSERVPMRLGDKPDVTEHQRALREALFSASLLLANTGLPLLRSKIPKATISRLLVTCSAPWSRTITRSISYKQKEEFKITEALIRELRENAEQKINTELNEPSVADAYGFEIVERATVDVKVNGYDIPDPVGLKTTSLELAHLSGLIPKDIVDTINEIEDKVLDTKTTSIHTYLLVFYCVMRDLYPHTHSFCIVDISGEATEFGIVEDNVLTHSAFAPYGSNTLLREMADAQQVPFLHALSQLHAYQEKALSTEESVRIAEQLEVYQKKVKSTLEQLYETHHIPQTVIITASPEVRGVLSEQIMLALGSVTDSKHSVLELEERYIRDIVEDGEDIFLAIAGRFFHKLHGCGEIE